MRHLRSRHAASPFPPSPIPIAVPHHHRRPPLTVALATAALVSPTAVAVAAPAVAAPAVAASAIALIAAAVAALALAPALASVLAPALASAFASALADEELYRLIRSSCAKLFAWRPIWESFAEFPVAAPSHLLPRFLAPHG